MQTVVGLYNQINSLADLGMPTIGYKYNPEGFNKQTHVKVAAGDLHTVVNPIIAPIQTKGDLIDVGSSKIVGHGRVTRPLGFIPLGGTDSLAQEKKNATAAMIQSADNGLFGANSIASTAMAAAAIVQWPALADTNINCYIFNSKL